MVSFNVVDFPYVLLGCCDVSEIFLLLLLCIEVLLSLAFMLFLSFFLNFFLQGDEAPEIVFPCLFFFLLFMLRNFRGFSSVLTLTTPFLIELHWLPVKTRIEFKASA